MNVTGLSSLIANTSPVAGVIISVALMLFSGFAMTQLTKLARLPNVTGYILAGILIGPYVLNLVPQRIIDGTDFLSDIALAFIAFSTGEFFKLSVLKKSGMKVVWITIFEAVLASVFIFILTFFVLRLDLAFSIVLAALASATAPASTMMTIRQTGAKGDFVDTLLQVVALDDVVGLVLYSIAISVALASLSGASGFSFETLGKPVLLNLLLQYWLMPPWHCQQLLPVSLRCFRIRPEDRLPCILPEAEKRLCFFFSLMFLLFSANFPRQIRLCLHTGYCISYNYPEFFLLFGQ